MTHDEALEAACDAQPEDMFGMLSVPETATIVKRFLESLAEDRSRAGSAAKTVLEGFK